MQKELKIDLDYLARTYGITLLESASVEYDDYGEVSLIIRGQTK